MKKTILFSCVFLCISVSFSCDICGAVNSSLGLGTIAMGNRHSLGLNYQFRNYRSTHPALFNEPETRSYETFHRLDLNCNVRLVKRVQLKIVAPLTWNSQQKDDITLQKTGVGDPAVSVNYFIADRTDSTANRQFRWNIGAGAKLPLGRFPEPHDPVLLLYPGTGTVDPTAQSALMLRWDKWGLTQEANVIIRTTNKYRYKPGNVFNATLFGFRRLGDFTLFSGFQYAWNGIDYADRQPINSSPARGNLLTTAVGVTWNRGNFQLQSNIHLPVVQQLGNGYVKQRTSVSTGIFYLFN